MKNVAGYDVSRLFAGSLGSLGLLLDVSLKVLPVAPAQLSLRLEMDENQALAAMNRWAGQPLPISASSWCDGQLTLRLSGARAAVASARQVLGGVEVADGESFWRALRHQRSDFFRQMVSGETLWRLSLPSVAPAVLLPGQTWIEWGGAQRWLKTRAEPAAVRAAALALGGHSTIFRGGTPAMRQSIGVFQPLAPAMQRIQDKLRRSFDPQGIFNPGRLSPA